jgi:hypothetical protein
MPRLLPSLALGALALLASLPAHSAQPAPDPWQTALAFDYNAAAEHFAALHKAAPADTRIAVAYASSLLVKQPRTEANIRQAHSLLVASSATKDEHAVLALYLLARVELDHLDPAQPAAARDHLAQLRRDHPAHPLADHAAVQLAYLAAYPPAGPDASAIAQITALLATVKAPEASRDLHQLLGSLQLRQLRAPAAALPHFVAARSIGFEQPLRNAESDLTIANLARDTGDFALARRHYAAFLAAAPRDVRASTVRRILASSDATPVTAAQ